MNTTYARGNVKLTHHLPSGGEVAGIPRAGKITTKQSSELLICGGSLQVYSDGEFGMLFHVSLRCSALTNFATPLVICDLTVL